jgi:hypothetical protein
VLNDVLEHQLPTNPLLQKWKTIMEADFPGDARGVPVVGSAAIHSVVHKHQEKDPTPHILGAANEPSAGPMHAHLNSMDRNILGGVTDTPDLVQQHELSSGRGAATNKVYYAGETERRNGVQERHMCDLQGCTQSDPRLTVESGVFPFLFPNGLGFNVGLLALADYLCQRMQQLWSPFTLVKEYLLVMYQVRCMYGTVTVVSCMHCCLWQQVSLHYICLIYLIAML